MGKKKITFESVMIECYAESTARKVVKHEAFKAGENVDLAVFNSEFEYLMFVGICQFGELYRFIDLVGEKISELAGCKYEGTGASCFWGSDKFEIKAKVVKEERED